LVLETNCIRQLGRKQAQIILIIILQILTAEQTSARETHATISFLIFNYQGNHKLIAAEDDYLVFSSRFRHYANYLRFIPCPKVSISLILLLEIIIFPVSSLMYLDVTGVNARSLNP